MREHRCWELLEQLMWCAPELLVLSNGFSSCAFVLFPSLFSSLSIQVSPVQARIAAPMSQLISRMPLHSGLIQTRQPSSRTEARSARERSPPSLSLALPMAVLMEEDRRRSDFFISFASLKGRQMGLCSKSRRSWR